MPRWLYDLLRHNAKQARLSGAIKEAQYIREVQIPSYSLCAKLPAKVCYHEGRPCR